MKIALVSDTHFKQGARAIDENWSAVRAWIASASPDLVVHLGDITADGANDPAQLDYAAEILAGLGRPARFLPGNHDIGDNPEAPGIPSEDPVTLERLARYRGLFGPDCWSFDTAAWRIIGLDAVLFGTGGPEEAGQMTWLAAELDRWSGPVGLMLHKPLFRTGRTDWEVHGRYVPFREREALCDLLAKSDLRFVVSGHVHQTRRFDVDGVEHVWAPSTAFCVPDALQERIGEKMVGMMMLRLGCDRHEFEFLAPAGLMRHNLLDLPDLYPQVSAIRARLGPAAEL